MCTSITVRMYSCTHVYMYCTHVLYTCTVHITVHTYYTHLLYTCIIIHIYCTQTHVLYTCICCIHVLYTCTVHITMHMYYTHLSVQYMYSCIHVLYTYTCTGLSNCLCKKCGLHDQKSVKLFLVSVSWTKRKFLNKHLL